MNSYLKNTFSDNLLKKLLKNAGILLSGNIYASILALFSLAITARALGPELFGVLILIQTSILVIDGIINMQSFQALIRYGTTFIEKNDNSSYRSLIKFGFVIDFLTAVLGMVVAILFVLLFSGLINIEPDFIPLVFIFSITILFHINGTPTAILRMNDQFNVFALKNTIQSSLKLLGVSIAYLLNGGIFSFVIVWVSVDIIGNLFLLYMGVKSLRNNGHTNIFKSKLNKLAGIRKEIVSFIFTTNVNSTVRMLSRQLDVLIIGSVMGAASAGLYNMAKQFSSILSKVSDPLYHAIYPQLTRLVTSGDHKKLKELTIKSGLIVGMVSLFIWAIFIIGGDYFILLTVGSEYSELKSVLIVYMFAIVISVFTFSFQPTMLAFGKPNLSLVIQLVSTVCYFILLYPLIKILGVEGAGVAYVLYYLIWFVLMGYFIYINIMKLEKGGEYELSS